VRTARTKIAIPASAGRKPTRPSIKTNATFDQNQRGFCVKPTRRLPRTNATFGTNLRTSPTGLGGRVTRPAWPHSRRNAISVGSGMFPNRNGRDGHSHCIHYDPYPLPSYWHRPKNGI